ncbi:MAG: M20/M25/M40 family metallo-hydrolase [Acholeplasma sp.]|nr:M20/M25/M40 family metallo-hydrolase [Acholeplasma sp.]
MKQITEIKDKAFNLADEIIKTTGPRLAGTKEAKQAAEILSNKLNAFADETKIEEFFLHKGAFLGWIRILVGCYLLAIVFLWFNLPIVSLVLALLSILVLVLQFFFYLPIIDIFYPKRKGYNVVGYIEPKDEVKNQVIVSGHHDSANIFNFLIHQPKLYNLRVTGSILFVILLCVFALPVQFIQNGIFQIIVKTFLSLGLLIILQMWFFASRKGTPGAGDNLIASTMAVEIGRYFSENKLNHTRVIVVSFDAEEEGLRGARAYAKKHQELFKVYPTTLLNTDCAYNLDDLFFLTSDINNTVKLSKELADELVETAKDLNYKAVTKPIAFLTGGTDAGELAKVGVKSTTLIGMPWSNEARSNVYHTPNDTLDNVDPRIIEASIEIFIEYIKKSSV